MPIILRMRRRPLNFDALWRLVRRLFNHGRTASGDGQDVISAGRFRDAGLNAMEIAVGDPRGLWPLNLLFGPIVRVIVEERSQFRRLDAFPATQRPEEGRHFTWIVSGPRQNLRAERMGFPLLFAAVFQKRRVEPEAAYRADDIRRRASADEPAKGAESGLGQLCLGRLTR